MGIFSHDEDPDWSMVYSLEKEIKTLEALISQRDASVTAQAEIIFELKAENERLKEEITELEEKFLTLNGKSYSYYLTLQEIKKIAENAYENDSEYQATGVYNEIIQKITKAESEG